MATNTLEQLSLRDIAEELDSMQEMEAVMASEKEIMEARHKKEITRRSSEQKTELENKWIRDYEKHFHCKGNRIKFWL